MANAEHSPDRFRWKRFSKNKKKASKVQLNDDNIAQWMKRVEMASELAVSEVFPRRRRAPDKRMSSQAMALQSMEQLYDHDEAYSEAQDLLNDWMNRNVRLELGVGEDEDEEEESVVTSGTYTSPAPPTAFLQSNFDDLYSYLDQDAEESVVHNILQELMEKEVVDSGMVEDLFLCTESTKTRRKNPLVTMEMRHQMVRENRARHNAARLRQQQEKELCRQAREEAQQREQEEQHRRKLEVQQQEELLQQEVVRLRRRMEEQRILDQRAQLMERERRDKKKLVLAPPSADLSPGRPNMQQEERKQLRRLQVVQARVHMLNLRCLQKHFSEWYSTVLERRVQTGKAAALCDWRNQLRAWRGWRSVVWARRAEREATRTEEELRAEKRRCQVALESDRRRLLRQFLSGWRVWAQAERSRRDLLFQQEEMQRKMTAFIGAATSGKLGASNAPLTAPSPPETTLTPTQPQTGQQGVEPTISDPPPAVLGDCLPLPNTPPTQAWQVTRRHTAVSMEDLQQVGQGVAPQRWGREEQRRMEQQRTIAEQHRRLREQRHQINLLLEEQRRLGLQQKEQRKSGLQRQAQKAPPPHPTHQSPTPPAGPSCTQQETVVAHSAPKTTLHPPPCPLVTAMEERARQRAERRREVEEVKRQKEDEKQALMRAELEQRQREEEEERKRKAEKRKEEKRQQREREMEKQHRVEQELKMQVRAVEHHRRVLLRQRGLAPWKRLLEKSHFHSQLAQDHHRVSLLRCCLLSWVQITAESLAEKEACATHLYQHTLLRRSLHFWLKLKDHSAAQEMQAERCFQAQTLRRTFMALLDHTTRERFAAWDREKQALEYWHRCMVRRCFQAWQGLPLLLRQEKEKEARRKHLRRQVADILPDFQCSPEGGARVGL
ncbi:hypothetical protein AAFF_G00091670 [Aldrovandia affinis]|uniref:Coiled-coil domain containing 191 n=1 Tax=Aldrovandia affinis TaxID=143900 RepID=A0AAD7WXE8_9TELE|nr:hypothetical protein AAFF_G00091670 [Aldrovandia affinis]